MILPEAVRRRIEEEFGRIHDVRPVGGGCINPSVRLQFGTGPAFLKYNSDAPPGLFAVEARGLEWLRSAAEELYVPQVVRVWDSPEQIAAGEPSWLLLEWLEPGHRDGGFGERLGRGLAALHQARQTEGWGWEEDGFIGPLPQVNAPRESWAEFWREHRLERQLTLARSRGNLPGKEKDWEHLFSSLPELLAAAEADGPSLLHGDLWSGNVVAAAVAGRVEPALVDPAPYRGHREVDLAMAELFGGFDSSFHTAYHETWPLRPGYREKRRAIYQLYFLLVHVNLFGGGYAAQTERVLRGILA